jgi:hypothetical protein
MPWKSPKSNDKGKVERGVDYAQENALKGKNFATISEQNAYLEHWEKTVTDTRIV